VKGPSFPLSGSAGSTELHLDEPYAHVFLGKGATNDKIDGWYLDTGVKGSVKFGDASAVKIKGVGSVIFKAKTGEHRLLTGAYYNPALKNSIINVRQLDENSSWVEIEDGVLRIWDKGRRLLAKVNRGSKPLCAPCTGGAPPLSCRASG
jgi:hypothetical protein